MFHSKNNKTGLDCNDTHSVLTSAQFNTPCGSMIAISDNDNLHFLGFVDRTTLQHDIDRIVRENNATLITGTTEPLVSIQKELHDYFEGALREFKTPLYCIGSPFQKVVWRALQEIPYGETMSYATLAKKIGKPSAFRAVANANGANPLSIIIPCHRVIQKNGDLGGYNGGVLCKQWLLAKEQDFITYRKIL